MKKNWSMFKYRLILIVCFFLRLSTVSGQQADLALLSEWLCGSFSSIRQSSEDSAFFDIRLSIQHIWQERRDGPWLYVEQAMAGSLSRPYRQRIYRLRTLSDSTFESAVYTLRDPLRFTGDREALEKLLPDSLEEKTGCAVVLSWDSQQNAFVGVTGIKTCASELRGASYATSEVILTAYGMKTWDRGYNKEDVQVWGSVKGGYQFDRVEK